jgi:hypothetical protein
LAAELRARTAPFFLRREKRDVLPPEGQGGGAAAGAEGGGGTAAGGPRPQAMGRKNDLVVWLRLKPLQKQVYSAFLSSSTVKEALNSTKWAPVPAGPRWRKRWMGGCAIACMHGTALHCSALQLAHCNSRAQHVHCTSGQEPGVIPHQRPPRRTYAGRRWPR